MIAQGTDQLPVGRRLRNTANSNAVRVMVQIQGP